MSNNVLFALYKLPQTVFSMGGLSLMFRSIPYNNLKRALSYYASINKLKKLRKGVFAKESYNPYELAIKLYMPSYISLETVLANEGIIFQKYDAIHIASYVDRTIKIDGREFILKRFKGNVVSNKTGVLEEKGYWIATKERAFLDSIYTYKDYYIDNLSPLHWGTVMNLKRIYANKTFEKRVESYYTLYKHEYVVRDRLGLSLSEALNKTVQKIEGIKDSSLLSGLGELVDEKQKIWIKEKLKEDLLFYINLYLKNLDKNKAG